MGQAVATIDESFEEVIRANRAVLLRTARRMTGGVTEADDLVQETLLKAFRSYGRLAPDSQVRAWLLRILSNTYISGWRRKKRERALLQPGVWEQHAPWFKPEPLAPSPSVPRREGLSDEVVRALDALPPHYKRIVFIVDIEQRTYREAAIVIGCPIGTVMSRLHRARRQLRQQLDAFARREGYLQAA